jgi:hypothetical protein
MLGGHEGPLLHSGAGRVGRWLRLDWVGRLVSFGIRSISSFVSGSSAKF